MSPTGVMNIVHFTLDSVLPCFFFKDINTRASFLSLTFSQILWSWFSFQRSLVCLRRGERFGVFALWRERRDAISWLYGTVGYWGGGANSFIGLVGLSRHTKAEAFRWTSQC